MQKNKNNNKKSNTANEMEYDGRRYANCHPLSVSLTHTLTFQLHKADFTDTDKQCEGSYHSTEHSNIEEEEEDDKEIGEDKKTECVSSES